MSGAEPAAFPSDTRLKDLRVRAEPVAITARIVAVERREIQRKSDGGRRQILSGLLSDGTATVRFTWWDPPKEEIDRGLVIRAAPVEVREFQGRPELSFGWRTRVAPASEHELPAVAPTELPLRSLLELAPRDERFRIEVRVAEVAPKTVTVGTERRQLHQGILADASGVLGFTAWTDFRLRPGEGLRIAGAYVRAFRGRPQVVLDERSRVERFEGPALPALGALPGDRVVALGLLREGGGLERALVEGRAVALQPPSGLVLRCPSCERLLKEGACRVHGAVEGRPDLRLRLVLDDGTGTVTLTLDRALVEKLTGRTLEACRDIVRETADPARVEGFLFEPLFGKRYRARGALDRDDFGLSMFPQEVVPSPPADPAEREALLRRLREGVA
jgi:replication factor A1